MKNLFIIILSALSLVAFSSAQDLIKSNMLVNVTVSGVPNSETTRLSNRYLVDGSGYLTMPMLETKVKASGVTGPALANRLSDAYKKAGLYSSPVFTVTTFKNSEQEAKLIREITRLENERASRKEEFRQETRVLHVLGHAKRPGEHKFTHGATIGVLLSKCGGDSEYGSNKRVILKRNGKSTTYNYKQQPSVLEIPLQPGDFLEIPKGTGFFGKN